MMGVFGVLIGDAVVHTYPFVPMIVFSHAKVEHIPSFLYKFSEEPSCALIFGVFVDMTHQQDNLFAHNGTLNGWTAVV
jgi:hypothetical protein